MALPVILINSGSGSDTAASGAGPATALTGSSASTNGAGTVVTLDGSPDLSGVATDGSHVIYLADTTAGNRNFGKITAKNDGADTVTVSDAFGASLTGKSWAIGGKRASLIVHADSRKLFVNNAGNGDAMPGWIMEMESAHTETFTGSYVNIARSGDTTTGPIIVRGASGAATKPILNQNTNDHFFFFSANYWQFRDFVVNSKSNHTASKICFYSNSAGGGCVFDGIDFSSDSGSTEFDIGISTHLATIIKNCEITACGEIGIRDVSGSGLYGTAKIIGNYIHDCGTNGIEILANEHVSNVIIGNVIANNGGDGIQIDQTRSDDIGSGTIIAGNTIYSNTNDGISWETSTVNAYRGAVIQNNLLHSNLGFGINLKDTAAFVQGAGLCVQNNGYKSNSSGTINRSGVETGAINDADVDNVSFGTSHNYDIGTSSDLVGEGFPKAIPGVA